MKGFGRVNVEFAVSDLLGGAAFFAVGGLKPQLSEAHEGFTGQSTQVLLMDDNMKNLAQISELPALPTRTRQGKRCM